MTSALDIRPFTAMLREVSPIRCVGSVQKVIGLTLEAEGLTCEVGELCTVHVDGRPLRAEVVGFRDGRTLLMPLGEWHGVRPGTVVEATGATFSVPMGTPLLGRVIDALGHPIDRRGPIISHERRHILADSSPDPLRRIPITRALSTGVRAIDGPLTVGRGQRMGIFAGSGVGKSTLLGMIARNASSDISVIGLIGERGREVREFIERDLGEEGLRRSVVVVTTSDQPALLRLKGAWLATAIAEHFREQGADVTLMMDSVTRFAMAQREIGLATGEPPAVKGYTPSVFALLPRLLERSGSSERGTITGFYTVLVEGDDLTEPVTDTVRGTLDGHIVLSRALAGENHYPAIDVLASVSRVMPAVTTPQHRAAAARLREVLSVYQNARDLVNIGAYVAGSNPQIDFALRMLPSVHEFLRQRSTTTTPIDDTVARLAALFPEAN
ncbi:MAG: FliI/YscN family ATPase [Dehalococcoidia bacterium]|nr:FliI/YscN family ATPase [Dehalococcoidia bacterium]